MAVEDKEPTWLSAGRRVFSIDHHHHRFDQVNLPWEATECIRDTVDALTWLQKGVAGVGRAGWMERKAGGCRRRNKEARYARRPDLSLQLTQGRAVGGWNGRACASVSGAVLVLRATSVTRGGFTRLAGASTHGVTDRAPDGPIADDRPRRRASFRLRFVRSSVGLVGVLFDPR